jgi:hypothetical protein
MTKNKKIAGTCTLDEAFERFASESEENRKVLEDSKRLIEGEGYVRLKRGVYHLAEMRDCEAVIWDDDGELTAINKRKIVKMSDDLEELCDVFVFSGFNNEKGNCDDYHLYKTKAECIEAGSKYYRRMFGAIWIKGDDDEPILQSVAKVNDKGELRLLRQL